MELLDLTIKKAQDGLIKKEFSAKDLVQYFLAKIEKLDKNIRAFLTITEDLAFSQAKKIDELISAGKDIPILAGIPLAI